MQVCETLRLTGTSKTRHQTQFAVTMHQTCIMVLIVWWTKPSLRGVRLTPWINHNCNKGSVLFNEHLCYSVAPHGSVSVIE